MPLFKSKFIPLLSLLLWTSGPKSSTARDPSLQNVYDSMSVDMDPSDYTIHDPSRIITVGKHQLIAVTGKAQEDGYDCGLETWWRKKGKGEWLPGQCLFRQKPSWVSEQAPRNDGAFWAPELDLKDGQLTLLYSVAEMVDNGPTTCVGIAKSTTGLKGFPNKLQWEDAGDPMFCIDGSRYDVERSAIDPSVFWGMGNDSNKLFMVTGGGYIIGTELDPETYEQKQGQWFEVGSNRWTELARGPLEQRRILQFSDSGSDSGSNDGNSDSNDGDNNSDSNDSDSNDGDSNDGDSSDGDNGSGDSNDGEGGFYDWVEAAYIHPNSDTGYYYLFVNWGGCCRGTDSTYEIRVGRSKNPMGPYLDKNGNDMMSNGGTLLEKGGNFVVGPGHAGIWSKKGKDYISFHYYDRRRGGNSWIAEKRLKWKNGWPKVSKKLLRPFPASMLN